MHIDGYLRLHFSDGVGCIYFKYYFNVLTYTSGIMYNKMAFIHVVTA